MHGREIPAIMKGLRTKMGLTQEQFARGVGVTCSTVTRGKTVIGVRNHTS